MLQSGHLPEATLVQEYLALSPLEAETVQLLTSNLAVSIADQAATSSGSENGRDSADLETQQHTMVERFQSVMARVAQECEAGAAAERGEEDAHKHVTADASTIGVPGNDYGEPLFSPAADEAPGIMQAAQAVADDMIASGSRTAHGSRTASPALCVRKDMASAGASGGGGGSSGSKVGRSESPMFRLRGIGKPSISPAVSAGVRHSPAAGAAVMAAAAMGGIKARRQQQAISLDVPPLHNVSLPSIISPGISLVLSPNGAGSSNVTSSEDANVPMTFSEAFDGKLADFLKAETSGAQLSPAFLR